MGLNDIHSLSHTKWNCKYHIVFAPKYRRMVFYKEKRIAIGKILRQLCEWKGVNIIEAEVCPDHVHMLVEIPPKISVSSFMGYLKGKSSTMLYEQFGELKYKYRNREFWCKGYYVDTVGKNTSRIAEYIKNQLNIIHAGVFYILIILLGFFIPGRTRTNSRSERSIIFPPQRKI